MRKKVTIIGAGNVGAGCAYRLAVRGLADVVLVDLIDGLLQGKALDILEATPMAGVDVRITGNNDYNPTEHSDVVVLTAGLLSKPGMTGDDMLWANYEIVRTSVEQAVKYSPNCILVVVTTPLEAMCHVAYRVSGFPKKRVVGMAGILDTARFRSFVAEALNVSVEDVMALMMGGHGDTMVPLVRLSSVAGIPVTELMDKDTIKAIIQKTRDGGDEIAVYLKNGSTYYPPSMAVVEMIDTILTDRKRVLPCSAYLEGEYGIHNLFVGVPVKLGAGGVEKIYEIDLNEEELEALHKSAAVVGELVDIMAPKLDPDTARAAA